MPGVSSACPLLAGELANALLDRGNCHRRADSVMFPLSTRHSDDLRTVPCTRRRAIRTRDALTSDRLQITKYRAATEAAAQRFPQVSGLLKARSAPRLPLRSGPLTGS